jgi:hypothetical protein
VSAMALMMLVISFMACCLRVGVAVDLR